MTVSFYKTCSLSPAAASTPSLNASPGILSPLEDACTTGKICWCYFANTAHKEQAKLRVEAFSKCSIKTIFQPK